MNEITNPRMSVLRKAILQLTRGVWSTDQVAAEMGISSSEAREALVGLSYAGLIEDLGSRRTRKGKWWRLP